jgi:hypothetical protein
VITIKDSLMDASVGGSSAKERIGADAGQVDSSPRTDRTASARDGFRAGVGGERAGLDRAIAGVAVVTGAGVTPAGSR